MKKILMLGAGALLFSTTAYAGPVSGQFNDNDTSSNHVTWSGTTPDNSSDDSGTKVQAVFTLTGSVDKTCAIQGVDGSNNFTNGLDHATINLGTIGISAGDDQSVDTLFTMTGPVQLNIHSAAAGCNAANIMLLSKSDAHGLINNNPGSYDTNQFQANIPYAVTASFTGVGAGAGAVAGTAQTVNVDSAHIGQVGLFGAWRSPLDIDITAPAPSKGLVGGTYQGTLTLELAVI